MLIGFIFLIWRGLLKNNIFNPKIIWSIIILFIADFSIHVYNLISILNILADKNIASSAIMRQMISLLN